MMIVQYTKYILENKITRDILTWMIQINGTTSYATVSRDDCVPLTLHHFLNEPRKIVI